MINLEQFQELKELLAEDFVDLITTYMNDSEIRLQEIQKAYDLNDNHLGFESAHNLKGASANLGANKLTELCYTLQEICRANQIHKHQQLIDEIVAESRAVNDEIKQSGIVN